MNKQEHNTPLLYYISIIILALSVVSPKSHAQTTYSDSMFGALGLNTVPNARMDETGTAKIGISTLDPYAHSYIGFQLADPIYINLRQTAEISNINADPDRLYPGIDLKLRLLEENHSRPTITLGLQSAIGHKRMAGEYIATSKRYKDFDFTAGIGWGRFAGAAHISNPLKAIFSHFGKARNIDGEMPNALEDWFTGQHIGFFGGIEYFTPIDGLSAKFDIGADRYEAEKSAFNYNAPAPWSIGLSYSPTSWINTQIALQGTDKIMGRLSLKGLIQNWRDKDATNRIKKTKPFNPHRSDIASPDKMQTDAAQEHILLTGLNTDKLNASAELFLTTDSPTPYQIGQTLKHMANHAGPTIESLELTPTHLGLHGPKIRILRADLEKAAIGQSSPEEIWQNAEFDSPTHQSSRKLNLNHKNFFGLQSTELALENHLSLAEEDSGLLYRESLIAGIQGPRLLGWIEEGLSLRLNIKDNLNQLTNIRYPSLLPVRSDIAHFAKRTLAINKAYFAITHSFTPKLHLSFISGYLEEMYAGIGGEILYRPFGKRFALGAESWLAFKRDPYTTLNLGLNGDHLLTGHLNAWYDIPYLDITAQAKFGRFLAEDIGGQLSLTKTFKNGAKLEGFLTITDQADYDLFGGTTHAYNGVKLTLPLGGFKYAPKNSEIRTIISPMGRDIGQSLDNPLPLYNLTESFSYAHLEQHWDKILDKPSLRGGL